MGDTILLVIGAVVLVVGAVIFLPRWAREAALREPSTKGDIRALGSNLSRAIGSVSSDVESTVAGIREELGSLHSDVSYVSEISFKVDGIREELDGIREELDGIQEQFDDIRSDLKAMRRLHRAVAHQQWTPTWTPE